jgi:hypothetical protein
MPLELYLLLCLFKKEQIGRILRSPHHLSLKTIFQKSHERFIRFETRSSYLPGFLASYAWGFLVRNPDKNNASSVYVRNR